MPEEHEAWPRVAICILNWNGWQDTVACLESVRRLHYPNFLTVVVDNCSLNDSAEQIKAWARGNFGPRHVMAEYDRKTALAGGETGSEESLEGMDCADRLVIVQNEENLGFAGGNNVAIRYALHRPRPADFVFLLNNDAKAHPNCLTRLVAAGQECGAGIVGAVVMDESGKNVIFGGVAPFRRQFLGPLLDWQLPPPAPPTPFWSSFFVPGTAMLISKPLLEAVHSAHGYYLIDTLFMYGEEFPLCFYADRGGFKAIQVRDALVYHKGGASTGRRLNPMSSYYHQRNGILNANKFLPPVWKCLFHLVAFPAFVGRVLKHLSSRRFRTTHAILCGAYDGYRGKEGKWKHHDEAYLQGR
jgi:hypothetical protein